MKALIHTITTRSEEITGTISAAVVGSIAHRTFADIILTLTIALASGFMGAMGAYISKALIRYFKKAS